MITQREQDEMKLQVREAIRLYRKEYEEAKLGDRLDAKTTTDREKQAEFAAAAESA